MRKLLCLVFLIGMSSLVGCTSSNKIAEIVVEEPEIENPEIKKIWNSAEWAYPFVKWDGNTYIVTKEILSESNIGTEIGEVTDYSTEETEERSYSGRNFSNKLNKGTKYFEIVDVSVQETIAVQNGYGKYVKAIKQ